MAYSQIHFISNVTFGGGERSLFDMAKGIGAPARFYLLRKTSEAPNIPNLNNRSLLRSKHSYNALDQLLNLIYAPFFVIFILIFNIRKEGEFDLVFHGFPFQFVLPLVRVFFKNIKGIHFVYHQNKRVSSSINKLVGRIEVFILKQKISEIYAVSLFSRDALIKYLDYFGLKKPNIKIFRLTVIFDDQLNSKEYSKLWSKLENKTVFIYPARFHKDKRHDRIIELAKTFIHKDEIIFILLGGGPDFSLIKKQLKESNLTNVLIPGPISSKFMHEFYLKSDGVIFPSENEAFGLVFLESLYYKKPVFVWKNGISDYRNVTHIDSLNKYLDEGLNLNLDESYINSILKKHSSVSSFSSIKNKV
jgi:glycosyltransferase involved in cell wall biosynthesis